MIPRRILIVATLAVGLAGLWFYQNQKAPEPSTPPVTTLPAAPPAPGITPLPPPEVKPGPSQIAMQPPKAEELAKVPPNPMAGGIGSGKVPPDREIALVLELFQVYRREFGSFPAGETNAQFLNALRGNNPGKLPVFPLEHPRLDAKGNLLDSWGHPYLFHPVSRERLEIRSAGPDGIIFTDDDLMVPK